jgi:hypothetical protein
MIVHDSGPAPDNAPSAGIQNEAFSGTSGNGYAFNFTSGSGTAGNAPPVPSDAPATTGNWGSDGFVFKPDLARLTVSDFEPGDSAGANFGHAIFGSWLHPPAPLQPIFRQSTALSLMARMVFFRSATRSPRISRFMISICFSETLVTERQNGYRSS